MFSFMSREANISTETRPIIKIFSNLLSKKKNICEPELSQKENFMIYVLYKICQL